MSYREAGREETESKQNAAVEIGLGEPPTKTD